MKTQELKKIFNELVTQYQDLKAEVIVSEVQENSNISEDDIVIRNNSTFARAFRRDIISVDPVNEWDPKLRLLLSRNGLYDRLPEGMFHSLLPDEKRTSPSERRKKQKKEQEEARSFFDPLENEFFHQKLEIEKNERILLDDFYNLKDQFLIDFWKLDQNIPAKYLLKLVKLLPSSYRIAGDLEMARMSLERILEVEVEFKRSLKYAKTRTKTKRENMNKKDPPQLGVDMVLESDVVKLLQPVIEVSIGPLSVARIHELKHNVGMSKFIETFYSYFLPMEFDVETYYIVGEERDFLLEDALEPVLGVTTKL